MIFQTNFYFRISLVVLNFLISNGSIEHYNYLTSEGNEYAEIHLL